MKNISTLVLLLFTFCGVQAQQLNSVPGTLAKTLPDGWYKYESEGATLDVEVTAGFISEGNINWFNNDSYSGQLRANEFSGKGTYKWANGERYEGSFKKNQRHGKGSIYRENGEKVSGKWKNDKLYGKVKVFKTDGTVEQVVWDSEK